MRRYVKDELIAKYSCYFKILILTVEYEVIPHVSIKDYSLISSEQDNYISCNQPFRGFNYAPK